MKPNLEISVSSRPKLEHHLIDIFYQHVHHLMHTPFNVLCIQHSVEDNFILSIYLKILKLFRAEMKSANLY